MKIAIAPIGNRIGIPKPYVIVTKMMLRRAAMSIKMKLRLRITKIWAEYPMKNIKRKGYPGMKARRLDAMFVSKPFSMASL